MNIKAIPRANRGRAKKQKNAAQLPERGCAAFCIKVFVFGNERAVYFFRFMARR